MTPMLQFMLIGGAPFAVRADQILGVTAYRPMARTWDDEGLATSEKEPTSKVYLDFDADTRLGVSRDGAGDRFGVRHIIVYADPEDVIATIREAMIREALA